MRGGAMVFLIELCQKITSCILTNRNMENLLWSVLLATMNMLQVAAGCL